MKVLSILFSGLLLLTPWGQAEADRLPMQLPQVSQAILAKPKVIQSKSRKSITVQSGSNQITLYPEGQSSAGKQIKVTSLEDVPVLKGISQADIIIESGETQTELKASELGQYVPPANGTYTYQITSGGSVYSFEVVYDLEPWISVAKETALGETAVIRVYFAENQKVTAKCSTGFTPVFYPVGPVQTALLPISYNAVPATYELTVSVGGQESYYSIAVNKTEFVEQHLTVDEGTAAATIESVEANQEWNQKIEPLKGISLPEKYWEGPFLQPVTGEITTQFGMARYTNQNPTPSRHSGIDIAAPLNTPVPAANRGKVIFAGYLKLTGNTVIIEHGLGLKSWYYHMNALNTKEGELVEKGDIIGKVGSTGFSTGAHLHYAMSVNQVFTNPWTAIETGYGLL